MLLVSILISFEYSGGSCPVVPMKQYVDEGTHLIIDIVEKLLDVLVAANVMRLWVITVGSPYATEVV